MQKMMILKESISNILEEMFFLVEETPTPEEEWIFDFCTHIEADDFLIKILISKNLAQEITVNFLGLADEPETEDITDCLQEILNMVTGNFVGLAYPDHKKLLPFPACKPCSNKSVKNDGFEEEFLFYHEQAIKILFKNK
ncbi:MAG: hypothetical protein K8S56_02285 [Candidatus Cloacimonetes bacterium]|nr:hypothetical protein [Candidatus Cloacimonadota bacterium]